MLASSQCARRILLSTLASSPQTRLSSSFPSSSSADSFGRRHSDPSPPPLDLAFKMYSSREPPKGKSPLFLHHSLLGCRQNWKKVAEEVHKITRRTTLTLDSRNHGQSPHSPHMTYSLMASDVQKLMADLQFPKISLLGHSMGGRVGMVLALTRPELVDRLVCVDATPKNSRVSLERWQTLQVACGVLKGIENELRGVKGGIERRSMADKAIKTILPNPFDRSLFISNLLTDERKNGPRSDGSPSSSLWRLNIDAILENPKMTASFPDLAGGRTFQGKTLFVSGERSQFLKRTDEPELLELFPNAKFVWIPDSGHWVQTEKHKEFMEAVVPFLESK